jgi:hypothetical protein
MANRLASGTTSIHVGGHGRPRLSAVATLVAVNGLGLRLSVGILKETVGVVETTECFTTCPEDDSDGGVVETAGVVETTDLTTRPEDDSVGGVVETADVVETTECLTPRPEDDSDGDSDGEPDGEGLVQSPEDDSGRWEVGVVQTAGVVETTKMSQHTYRGRL